MNKLEISKTMDKISRKAIIRFRSSSNLKLELIDEQKNCLLFKVNMKNKSQIEDLIKILKNKNIKHVILESLENIIENKMDKIEIINKFTSSNIKCLELQNGYNNYSERTMIDIGMLLKIISEDKQNNKLQKDKKTIAYMSFKENNENKKERLYMQQQSAENSINQYAQNNGLEISEIFVDYIPSRLDIKNRESLNKLISKIKKEDIGQVLIPKIEHISRNTVMTVNIINEICKNGTKVVLSNDNCILG